MVLEVQQNENNMSSIYASYDDLLNTVKGSGNSNFKPKLQIPVTGANLAVAGAAINVIPTSLSITYDYEDTSIISNPSTVTQLEIERVIAVNNFYVKVITFTCTSNIDSKFLKEKGLSFLAIPFNAGGNTDFAPLNCNYMVDEHFTGNLTFSYINTRRTYPLSNNDVILKPTNCSASIYALTRVCGKLVMCGSSGFSLELKR